MTILGASLFSALIFFIAGMFLGPVVLGLFRGARG